jgi:hypothetical protein
MRNADCQQNAIMTDAYGACAPVALFVYQRPRHTRQTIEALQRNSLAAGTDLIVFSDAAGDRGARRAVAEVRELLRTISGFKSVAVVERETNLGLAESIISGVSDVCARYGRVIVLEDDLVTSPDFLRFMNQALDVYQDVDEVASIHGYWYPIDDPVPETFLLRGASCWGWATWKRAWALFEPDGRKLLAELQRQDLTRLFDLEGSKPYTFMLKAQVRGKSDSWAIRWHASTFLAGRYQLSPGHSLVNNIGFDWSGTHCSDDQAFSVAVAQQAPRVGRIPIVESKMARAALIRYFWRTRRTLLQRIVSRLKRISKVQLMPMSSERR